MFTGIVEEMGQVLEVDGYRLTVQADRVLEGLAIGDSVAVNGACLTVTALTASDFQVEVTPETLRRTNLGVLRAGDAVDLERAMALGDRLGGHLVQGHVDATGQVLDIQPEGNAHVMRFRAPEQVMRYVATKGFITVDGASLTVVDIDGDTFTISVIPLTYRETVLGARRKGDMVNLEIDIIAKYVERLLGREDESAEGASGNA